MPVNDSVSSFEAQMQHLTPREQRLARKARRRAAMEKYDKGCVAMCWGILGLVVVSLSPSHIHSLAITKVSGKVVTDYESNTTVPIKITVGPAGGCMWYEDVDGPPTQCKASQPFKPDPKILHLPSNQTLTNAFSAPLGKALIVNHLATAFGGLTLILFTLDALVFQRGFSRFFIWLTFLLMWAAFALEIAYVVTTTKSVSKAQDQGYYIGDLSNGIGNGFWMILASCILVSGFFCGCGGTGVGSNYVNFGIAHDAT
ncbi:hypothetical protein I316_03850 [Kwoniella heveanensis BCC8398]|uniref:MARVEL domain-containing protein n=1 Tax=Kwoniella heveanensis BCC8398 TaxID=1296120 RepID=A0A1B9GTJ2_9TREE|nr:hypothetical protein I316_03850 [Kwoniella heveanensis BCC8398]